MRRPTLLAAALAVALASITSPANAEDRPPLEVVATFSILGDMVERIGGDDVSVRSLVGSDGDTHVFRPTPADAQAIGEADVLVLNGLEFEGWVDRLVSAAEFKGLSVVATDGANTIAFEEGHDDEHHDDEHAEDKHSDDDHGDHARHEEDEGHDGEEHAGHDHHGHDHGSTDPHAWQSLRNAVTYATNIADGLSEADPARTDAYHARRDAYIAEIEALDSEIETLLAALPRERRTIVTSHDAFQYFGRDYGLTFLAPQGWSTDAEASAQDVAALIIRMREEGVAAVFVENITDPRLLKRIADETGAAIGGTLYPGALSGKDGPAPTYLDMMRHNARTLASALGS